MRNSLINRGRLINIDKSKSVGIQYIRAVCALIVFFSHYTMGLNLPSIISFRETPLAFIVDGSIAVSVFLFFPVSFISKPKN